MDLKGFRTVIFAALVATVPALTSWLAGIQAGVTPLTGAIIGIVIIALRFMQTRNWDLAGGISMVLALGMALIPGVLGLLDVIKTTELGMTPIGALVIGTIAAILQKFTNTPVAKSEPKT